MTTLLSLTQEFPSIQTPPQAVMLRPPPLDSKTGWDGELWSKTDLIKSREAKRQLFYTTKV